MLSENFWTILVGRIFVSIIGSFDATFLSLRMNWQGLDFAVLYVMKTSECSLPSLAPAEPSNTSDPSALDPVCSRGTLDTSCGKVLINILYWYFQHSYFQIYHCIWLNCWFIIAIWDTVVVWWKPICTAFFPVFISPSNVWFSFYIMVQPLYFSLERWHVWFWYILNNCGTKWKRNWKRK